MTEKKNSSKLIASGIILVCIAAIFLTVKKKNEYKEEALSKSKELEQISEQNQFIRAKTKADELLITGNYEEALTAYLELAKSTDSLEFAESRKAIVNRFKSINSKLDQSISNSEWAEMERQMNKKLEAQEQAFTDSINAISQRYDKKLSSLTNKISQQEQQLQNKAELGRLTFYNAKGTKIAFFGEVKFGKANGEGVGHYSSNSVYDGEWKNNMKHGKGTYKWIDGHKYVGEYKNDKRSGKGTYYWNTGEKYEGDWKNNKRNGKGTLYDKDGNVKLEGNWVDDEFVN